MQPLKNATCIKAFALKELVLTVLIIAVLAAIAGPRINYAATTRQKTDSATRKIITDFRRTRTLAISGAAINTAGFALKMTGPGPYTGYEIENLDTTEIMGSHTIDPATSCSGGSDFEFGPGGNLRTSSDTQLTVSASGRTFSIDITPATGLVVCTEN